MRLLVQPDPRARQFATPNAVQVNSLKDRLRRTVIDWLVLYVRHRVRDENLQKGRAPILGYSTNPIVIPYVGNPKAHRRPRGGVAMGKRGQFFEGGYAEYREKVGLGSAFQFYNTGDAWRDWKALSYGSNSTPGEIGFTKQVNAMAASAAEEKRPELFFVDERELSMVHLKVVEQINATFFGASTP